MSPTGSDRPPTILSPHGEGYCRWCQFTVGLTPHGLLERHYRGKYSDGVGAMCKGSDTVPPKLTPYSSRKAAFRVVPKTARCPGCVQEVATTWVGGIWVYEMHRLSPSVLCDWRYRTVVTD